MKNIIFEIKGGIGKNVMATAVAKAIKTNFPDHNLIVVTAYDGVWINNPNVFRTYKFGALPYFYEDYIKGHETTVFAQEPYMQSDFILKKKHLIEVWCDMVGVPYNGEQPEIILTKREQYFYKKKYASQKPILILQTNGGVNKSTQYSWTRDIPIEIARKLSKNLIEKFQVIHIRFPKQPEIVGVNSLFAENIRDIFGLIQICQKLVVIDSFVQHVAKAFKKEAIVCFPVDNVNILGYDSHINIVSEQSEEALPTMYNYMTDNDINGDNLTNCPFEDIENLFSVTEIVEKLDMGKYEIFNKPALIKSVKKEIPKEENPIPSFLAKEDTTKEETKEVKPHEKTFEPEKKED